MKRPGMLRLAGAALLACSAAVLVTGGVASAHGHSGGQKTLLSGDDRAAVHDGNVTTCDQAGLGGTTIRRGDLEGHYYVDDDTYITIMNLPDGTALSAIVVKGSHAWNLYQPGQRGLPTAPPYSRLHSPIAGGSGSPAAFSHWFVCGTLDHPTTTPPTSPSETPSGAPPTCSDSGSGGMPGGTDCSTPTEGPTPSGAPTSGGAVEGSSTTPPAPQASTPTRLASTGFDAGFAVTLAALLLLAGVLLIAAPAIARARRARSTS